MLGVLPENRSEVMAKVKNGIKFGLIGALLIAGSESMAWTKALPLTIGPNWYVFCIGFGMGFSTLTVVDSFASAKRAGQMHESAVEWLNTAPAFRAAKGDQVDRMAILWSNVATALGHEILFRGAVPAITPHLGAGPFEKIPMGLLFSVAAYALYHDDDKGAFSMVNGGAFAVAAGLGGLAAAVVAHVVFAIGLSSMLLFARNKKKDEQKAKEKEAKEKKKAGSGSSTSAKKKR